MSAARHVQQLDARERNPLAFVNAFLAVAAVTLWLIALPGARHEASPRQSPSVLPLIYEDDNGGEEAASLVPASVLHE